MKKNNSGIAKIIVALILILVIGSLANCYMDSDKAKREFLEGLSPKEYYEFSQRAYKYNHRND